MPEESQSIYWVYTEATGHTSFIGATSATPTEITRYKLQNPTWFYELERRPEPPPPVQNEFKFSTNYHSISEAPDLIQSFKPEMFSFYDRYNPSIDTKYKKKALDYKHTTIPTYSRASTFATGSLVSTDNGFWEARKVISANGVSPPTTVRVENDSWKPFDLWDSNGLRFTGREFSGKFNIDKLLIDPREFTFSMQAIYTPNEGYGMVLYAGANKPADDVFNDVSITEGILIYMNTRESNGISFDLMAANGTNEFLRGSNAWIPSDANGVRVLQQKRLFVPVVGTRENPARIKITHFHGFLTIFVNEVYYGSYTYNDFLYPFRINAEGEEVNHRNVNFGLIGLSSSDPSEFIVKTLSFGKAKAELMETN